jgi:hypothetical protein
MMTGVVAEEYIGQIRYSVEVEVVHSFAEVEAGRKV